MPAIYGLWAFLWLRFMDETEYYEYLCQIDDMTWGANELENGPLQEQLRDENGYRIEGCYRTNPAPTLG